jgi:hypothetical protein
VLRGGERRRGPAITQLGAALIDHHLLRAEEAALVPLDLARAT